MRYTRSLLNHDGIPLMTERTVLIQRIINQRTAQPDGLRIWSDGLLQRTAEDNPPPGSMDRLDKDRELKWRVIAQLSPEQVEEIRATIRSSGFFELQPVLLINYCKEDPGTAIWTVSLDGQTARVVVFDPRTRRSSAIDLLNQALDRILTV
jgi:hypothetical protein